jgi:GTP-binding protein Era
MVLYVLDASRAPGPEEEAIAAALAPRLAASVTPDRESPEGESAAADSAGPANSGIIAAVNKMDLPGADYGRTRDFLRRHLPALPDHRCFPLSAKKNQGIDPLLASLFEHAPGGPPFYPAEYYTDQEMDFRIAEIIRGEAIKRLREELPHAFYVEVADREFRADGKRLWVRAFIICERESQKGMIVGKGGALIKAIGEAARRELDRIFDWKLELDLRVKTGKNWRHNDRVLRKILG